jgi:NAD(P)H-hydrate epimerase
MLPDWLEPLPDAAQQRAIDRWAIDEQGVAGDVLMERAGRALAAAVDEQVPDGRIAVVCGKGNNGGDGRIAARVLRDRGRDVIELEPPLSAADLTGSAACVDALLGTGSSGAPREEIAAAIELVNASGATVIACDIPSGVDGSTGEVAGAAVRADATVTFHAAKPGLWIAPGKQHAGIVTVAEIGIPADPPVQPTIGLITDAVLDQIPRRNVGSTKFTAGNVLVVGGSPGLTGAPIMAARAAARAGAGYVTLAAPPELLPSIEARLLEVMSVPIDRALELSARAAALVVGPGLGRDEDARQRARLLAHQVARPMVLDADGLFALAGALEALAERSHPTVLTPHVGELARLLAIDPQHVNDHRLTSAQEAAELSHAVVVLKGDDTIIASPDGTTAISRGGAPALATAGTGDVLAGVIGSFLAKGVEPFTAACAGVQLHLRAGRLAADVIGAEGVIASDIIELLPKAWPS